MNRQKSLFSFALTLLMALAIYSCKDTPEDILPPDDTIPVPTDTTDTIIIELPEDTTLRFWGADLNDAAFVVDTSTITYNPFAGLYNFSGASDDGNLITMLLPSLDPGTYEINNSTDAAIAYDNGTYTFSGGINPQGEIVISYNQDNKITGTFSANLTSFQTTETITIENGHFRNLVYTP